MKTAIIHLDIILPGKKYYNFLVVVSCTRLFVTNRQHRRRAIERSTKLYYS